MHFAFLFPIWSFPKRRVGMEIEILDGQTWGLFSNDLFEKRPVMTIEDFDFHFNDHFESHLARNGQYVSPQWSNYYFHSLSHLRCHLKSSKPKLQTIVHRFVFTEIWLKRHTSFGLELWPWASENDTAGGIGCTLVSWQYQKCWFILILLLCLLCVTLLVCSSYLSFAPPSSFFNCWWHRNWEWFSYKVALWGSPLMSSRQSQMIHVLVDSIIRSPCHAPWIYVAHALPKSHCSFLPIRSE